MTDTATTAATPAPTTATGKLEAIIAGAKARAFEYAGPIKDALHAIASHVDEVVRPAVTAAAAPLTSLEQLATTLRAEFAGQLASGIADAKTKIEADLQAVFEAWATKQVAAVEALSEEVAAAHTAIAAVAGNRAAPAQPAPAPAPAPAPTPQEPPASPPAPAPAAQG